MVFKKGNPPWNKGLTKETDERVMKYSLSLKGKTYEEIYGKEMANIQKRKISEANKGKTWEEMYGKNHSVFRYRHDDFLRKRNPMFNETTRKKISSMMKGRTLSSSVREKIRKKLAGNKNHFGHKHTEEVKEKLRYDKLGRTYEEMYGPEKAKEIKKKLMRYTFQNTSIERKIMSFLDDLNIVYLQQEFMDIKHFYRCDAFIPSLDLVIECDGNYWHNYPYGKDIDHLRTKELEEDGYNVLRLWESEIKEMDIYSFQERLNESVSC